jgi:hypothetical protein
VNARKLEAPPYTRALAWRTCWCRTAWATASSPTAAPPGGACSQRRARHRDSAYRRRRGALSLSLATRLSEKPRKGCRARRRAPGTAGCSARRRSSPRRSARGPCRPCRVWRRASLRARGVGRASLRAVVRVGLCGGGGSDKFIGAFQLEVRRKLKPRKNSAPCRLHCTPRTFLRTLRPQPHPAVASVLCPPRLRMRRLAVRAESRHAPFKVVEVA